MKCESALLIGVCRPVPDVLSFVTPVFRDRVGATVAQMVKEGRVVSFAQVDLGEEFVPLRSFESASVGDPAFYAMEFQDGIAVGRLLNTMANDSGDVTDWSDANAIRAAFERGQKQRSNGFLTFRRMGSAPERFEREIDDNTFQGRRRKRGNDRPHEHQPSGGRYVPAPIRRVARTVPSHHPALAEEIEEVEAAMPEEDSNRRLVRWFRRWRKPIRMWLSHRTSVGAADLDDLAQEVFLRLLRYSDDVAIDNPQGYLFRIAAAVAQEWTEGSRRGPVPRDDSWLEDLETETDDGSVDSAQQMANSVFQAAIARLPERYRETLLLHVNDGLTYKQIAERQGVTYRVVLRDLTRAYSMLRQDLRGRDIGPSTDAVTDDRHLKTGIPSSDAADKKST